LSAKPVPSESIAKTTSPNRLPIGTTRHLLGLETKKSSFQTIDEVLLVLVRKQNASDVGDVHLDAVLAVVKRSKTPRVFLRSGREPRLDVTDEVAFALSKLVEVSDLRIGPLGQRIR
jgi:hypothetical protein